MSLGVLLPPAVKEKRPFAFREGTPSDGRVQMAYPGGADHVTGFGERADQTDYQPI
jgi:hypothetical protein